MKLSPRRKLLKFYLTTSNAESAAKKRIYNKSLKFVRISTLKGRFYYLFDRKAVLFFTYILLRFWSALNELAPFGRGIRLLNLNSRPSIKLFCVALAQIMANLLYKDYEKDIFRGLQ